MYKNIAKIRKVCNIEGLYTVVPLGRDTMCYYTGHLLQAGLNSSSSFILHSFFVKCIEHGMTLPSESAVGKSAAVGGVLLFTEQGLQQPQLGFELLVLAVLLCHGAALLLLANPASLREKVLLEVSQSLVQPSLLATSQL